MDTVEKISFLRNADLNILTSIVRLIYTLGEMKPIPSE